MQKIIIKILSIALNLLALTCIGQTDNPMIFTSSQELNKICVVAKVYDLAEIDSLLYIEIKENAPNIFSSFKLSAKSKNVGLYQIGNVGDCKDCTPTTYFFIVHQNEVMFFNNNQDIKTPQSELDKLEKEGKLDAAEKTILMEELKRIIRVNINDEVNREQKRW